MAKNNKKDDQQPQKSMREKSTLDYYKLDVKAVDDLVNADVSNSPKVSKEEIAKYSGRSAKRFRIPSWLKICFIKFWFSAAIPGSPLMLASDKKHRISFLKLAHCVKVDYRTANSQNPTH